MVSSQRSYWSFTESKAPTKCWLAPPPDSLRAFVCSSIMALVNLILWASCLATASLSSGNNHRNHGMCSANVRAWPSFDPLLIIARSSSPCSSVWPSEFTNDFPNITLVIWFSATAPRYFLNNWAFPEFLCTIIIIIINLQKKKGNSCLM